MDALVQEVKQVVESLDKSIVVTEYQVRVLLNRVRVYLNRKDIPSILVDTVAEILLEQHAMDAKNKEDTISSISDSGQSISFSNKVFNKLVSQKDVDLFASHTSILNRFRKVGVIGVDPFKDG